MYHVVNLESRTVLTRRDGSRILYGSGDLAQSHAEVAQHLTGHPHATLPVTASVLDSLRRSVAPWFVTPART